MILKSIKMLFPIQRDRDLGFRTQIFRDKTTKLTKIKKKKQIYLANNFRKQLLL